MKNYIRPPWMFENPLCRQVGGDLFFTSDFDDPGYPDKTLKGIKEAKKICAKCVHIVECGEWGIRHESHGVWGGLDHLEISRKRRRRNIFLEVVDLFGRKI